MRIRHGLLMALAFIALICASCSNNDNKDKDTVFFGGSNPMLLGLHIGTVPVKSGQTVNVPLGHVQTLLFDLGKAVTPASLDGTLNFSIRIEKLDQGNTVLLSQGVLDQNGDLFWLDTSNRKIEYRMTHDMSYIVAGGQKYVMGKLGDKFRIHIDFLIVNSADGRPFSITGDEFFVVWTESATGPLEQ